jgi:hypothetical protein
MEEPHQKQLTERRKSKKEIKGGNKDNKQDLIQLRKEYKNYNKKTKRWDKHSEDVPFTPTEKTQQMESRINKFNALSGDNKITVCLGKDDLVSLEELTRKIMMDLMKGKIELRIGSLRKNGLWQTSVLKILSSKSKPRTCTECLIGSPKTLTMAAGFMDRIIKACQANSEN